MNINWLIFCSFDTNRFTLTVPISWTFYFFFLHFGTHFVIFTLGAFNSRPFVISTVFVGLIFNRLCVILSRFNNNNNNGARSLDGRADVSDPVTRGRIFTPSSRSEYEMSDEMCGSLGETVALIGPWYLRTLIFVRAVTARFPYRAKRYENVQNYFLYYYNYFLRPR